MTQEPNMLSARDLSKRFGAFQALRDASFSVCPGEILGLIGPNGSGKTTLFQCVAGTMPADSGTVTVRGDSLPAESRKKVLFFMPDGIRPWPDQTVDWTLEFIRNLHGVSVQQRNEIVGALGVTPLLRSHLGELSKGEHKRVLVAAGMLTDQPLLMLDEPFDGLDLRQTREVMDVLRRRTSEGRTLFLSIHQLGDAARVCDRFVLLSGGRTVGEGTLDELRVAAGLSDAGAVSLEEVFLALT
jgi:ABC-2 type transport system ATP-binding protein